MKKIKYTITILAAYILASCHKLNVPPLNIISEDQVFSSANGVEAYLANIYTFLPMEDFVYEPNGGFMTGNGGRWQCFYHTDAIDGEMAGPFGGTGDAATGFGFWPYDRIRVINILINDLPKYASLYTPAQVNEWLGEAYFCRAYTYFAIVKRYGGVPIVKTVVDPNASIASLQVPRNTEEDCYKFIGADFDTAYSLMWVPGASGNPSIEQGAASKYAAMAYKSRAMLYAATIAKYGAANYVDGPARAAGLVGIPAGDANTFFQAAYDAAKLVEGQFSLYTGGYPDKEQNYVDLFLKPNNEQIFIRQYSQSDPNLNSDNSGPHSWDATMTCRIMTGDGLSRAYPDYDYVERYGELPIVNADGTPTRFNNLADITNGLEPRLLATVYFPGMTLRGQTFDQQRGIYKTFTGSAAQELSDNLNTPNDVYGQYPDTAAGVNLIFSSSSNNVYAGHNVIGRAGFNPSTGDDNTRTGFYLRKYINYNAPASACGLYQSTQSYIDMRYAEVLLNRAEAAYELGNTADALADINAIRDRAGAVEATNSMTIDTIRNERDKELAFEHQYWWDIRRWRIADQVLDNRKLYGLMPYYISSENKFIFLKQIETFQRTYTFQKIWYYEPLPGGELAKNPNLYPNNPGY
ncbi:RagB/SusD family nutrient uptake outer membrane protein [Dinghuibacter silviterrae]|uniref:Putative outer membrane starch-binding protein n=1 Tax=Dinghuibacter silviterrae TaxID=1539049 RepID=A0A4R8DI05_9BACT|nr:RagB/SusD family nutrient uptake outer membrane protein [Dinghuibacter silviterrae]TDW96914.1 putative outer membrane starch-binding protein [Dinghuibacter silviterrae]